MPPAAKHPQPTPRKTLDISTLDLRGAENGLLSEESLQSLEEYCKQLCTKHFSLDQKDVIIIRQGVSPTKKLSPNNREYTVACSLTSSGDLFCFTLHYRKDKGFNVVESPEERISEKYKVFSVFFQASTVADLKKVPTPQVAITPSKENHHAARTV